MPSNSETNGDTDPPVRPADAAIQIHQMALQSIEMARKAKLGFLVYLLTMVAEESERIANLS